MSQSQTMMQSHGTPPPHAARQPITRRALHAIIHAGKTIGHTLYGDEIRTKRSTTFSYLCIGLYLLSVINADKFATCAL